MIQEIQQAYISKYGHTPLLIKAPGRINLIGEHTDYNNGFVMPAAIDKAIYFAIGKEAGRTETFIQAINYNETLSFGGEQKKETPSWGNYFKAILEILKEKGHAIEGINCLFGGDIPIGAGLSSSAALCCGFIFGISELYDLQIPRTEIALLGQQAEHRIGLNCGLMDQYAVLFGKEKQVFRLDCNNLKVDYFPFKPEGYSLVLINSKIEHQLSEGSGYNERRASCERVVAHLAKENSTIKSLRDVNFEMLQNAKADLDATDYQRTNYVLEENQRVEKMMAALENHQYEEVGNILLNAHEGMSKAYDISLPEIDLLVSFAEAESTVLGARMMGGGFGGCTINLIANENKADTLNAIQMKYQAATGITSEAYEVKIGEGIHIYNF